MTRKNLLVMTVAAVLMIGTAYFQGQEDPDTGPQGLKAFKEFSRLTERPVRTATSPRQQGETFILTADLRPDEEAEEIVDWVRDGGRLVLAAPGSAIARKLGVTRDRTAAFTGDAELEPACLIPETVGVSSVKVLASDVDLDPGGGSIGCFNSRGTSYLVSVPYGAGQAFVLGGPSIFTNRYLREGDAAVLVDRLLGDGPVVLGTAVAAGEPEQQGVWRTLPLPARVLIVGLGLCFVLFAITRARRFGRPVAEIPMSPIPATELVRASANMYQSAKAREFVAAELRGSFMRTIGRRMGIPPGIGPSDFAAAAASRLNQSEERLRQVLEAPASDSDDSLINLARELEDLRMTSEVVAK